MDKTNYKQYSNLQRSFYTLKTNLFALIICLFFLPFVIMAQSSTEPKEKVEKVTEKMLEKDQPQSDSLRQKQDFAEISKAVGKGTVPTVIKALSLAALIAGFAILYLPKKKKEVSNG
jgi:hypothetical protein